MRTQPFWLTSLGVGLGVGVAAGVGDDACDICVVLDSAGATSAIFGPGSIWVTVMVRDVKKATIRAINCSIHALSHGNN